MRANDLDPSRLRRLAGLKTPGSLVLSLYVDLDPTTFATPPARETQVTSLVDETDRRLRDCDLGHEARTAARRDLGRAREAMEAVITNGSGALGLAVFASEPADLFEVLRLPRPVDSRAVIDDSPWIEPLVRFGRTEHVCVALVDRHHVRVLHGTRDGLEELDPASPELRHPTDEAPPADVRHPRANDHEVRDHVKRVGYSLSAVLKSRGFDCLVIGAPGELRGAVEEYLHPYVRERFGGWLDVPVEYSSIEDVRRAAAERLDEERTRRDDDVLERLREGLGRGDRAAAGLRDVLPALNERRVETLLYDAGLQIQLVVCPRCGFLGVDEAACPLDGTATERRESGVENATETAMLQAADVRVLVDRPDLGPYGGIAATLRF
jgi:peptide chain release factor subunit 1